MNLKPLILAAGLVALWAWYRRANASTIPWQSGYTLQFDQETGQQYLAPIIDSGEYTAPDNFIFSDNANTMTTDQANNITAPALLAASYEQRLAAFMATIKDFEANGRYDVIYGGQTFTDFSRHPNIRVPFINPRTKKNDYSTAAGAYQINYPTWATEIQPALNLPDFSPQSQDIAARWLIENRTTAGRALANGDIAGAYRAASSRWASLPGSDAQQNPKAIEVAMAQFNNYIGA